MPTAEIRPGDIRCYRNGQLSIHYTQIKIALYKLDNNINYCTQLVY